MGVVAEGGGWDGGWEIVVGWGWGGWGEIVGCEFVVGCSEIAASSKSNSTSFFGAWVLVSGFNKIVCGDVWMR